MPQDDAIQIEARVIEVLPNNMVRVELANGHRILTRMSGPFRMSFRRLDAGDTVIIEVSPFDLSKGCILEKK